MASSLALSHPTQAVRARASRAPWSELARRTETCAARPDGRSLAVDASASRTAMPLMVHKHRSGDSHQCASVCICGQSLYQAGMASDTDAPQEPPHTRAFILLEVLSTCRRQRAAGWVSRGSGRAVAWPARPGERAAGPGPAQPEAGSTQPCSDVAGRTDH
jgi:hypothetical protein